MPSINAFLTSIQNAVSCIEERLRDGWPTDAELAQVQSELSEIDERLWAMCEVEK